jgi:hypothetical protein
VDNRQSFKQASHRNVASILRRTPPVLSRRTNASFSSKERIESRQPFKQENQRQF